MDESKKVLMKESVIIAVSPEGRIAIKSNMKDKAETMGMLLSAVSIVAMQKEEVKSPIIKPTAQQVKVVSH